MYLYCLLMCRISADIGKTVLRSLIYFMTSIMEHTQKPIVLIAVAVAAYPSLTSYILYGGGLCVRTPISLRSLVSGS
jgi:hypothetical protein